MGDGDSQPELDEAGSTVRMRQLEESGAARPTVPHLLAVAPVGQARAPMPTPRELVVPSNPAGAHATLTSMSGLEAGRVFSIDGEEVLIGRASTCHIWIDDASVSRQHARIVRHTGDPFFLEDLGSTNGTFVGERRIARCQLASGDRVQIGPSFLLRFAMVDLGEERLQKDLFHAATRDPLSGLYNRRYFDERLMAEVSRARRSDAALTICMIDLDRFKRINDRHGHLAGDQVLREVSAHLAKMVRLEDVLARYGGEELVLLAPATDTEEAALLGERLRAAVERLAIEIDAGAGTSVAITVSVGVACLSELDPHATPRELLARADARLYRAKQAGRNRVATIG
jgi:two-component system, cell cycle response regulator